jgi:hypothetical protein
MGAKPNCGSQRGFMVGLPGIVLVGMEEASDCGSTYTMITGQEGFGE